MHRDLNDIIPPSRRRALDLERPSMDVRPTAPPTVSQEPEEREPLPPMPKPPRRRAGGGFPLGTAIIAIVVVVASALVLYAFAGAKVAIVPHVDTATISADMSATSTGDLPFQVITVEKTATVNVPAEGTENASVSASGQIVIANQQTVAQPLIKNTRFETSNGLIYRIHDSVTVPAAGSVTATVYADAPGEQYNIAPTTFTVPGLKGTKAYDLVTAKSATPMTGGFVGTRPTVNQQTKDTQDAQMQTKLSADLGKDLAAKIPAGYVLVPGASFTSYAPQDMPSTASGTATLGEAGTMTAVVFPADALARAIAFKSVGTYGGQPVTVKDVSGLTVKPAQPSIAPDATQFDFNLSGTVPIIWQVDPAKIAGAVAGKTRTSSEIALKSFPEVDKATMILRPFWASHFPADPTKIKVIVSDPTAKK